MSKRVFLIVLDSFGVGEAPDAARFGDEGSNTLKSISKSEKFSLNNLCSLGFSQIEGLGFLPQGDLKARVARLKEKSNGKDTTTGHWEIAGLVSKRPMPVFPDGFPDEIIKKFSAAVGRGVLCNKPYSGTEVIKDYGKQHLETGDLIVYTSADSVFQIAAHESIVPPEKLYEYCRAARKILTGDYGVGRVIARPFEGEYPFTRTPRRHDFSLEPPEDTLLDELKARGFDVLGVGKIHDIFAGRGLTDFVFTEGNTDGMKKTLEFQKKDFNGLCFVNLVDFDMLYGHRNDVEGYAAAAAEFDGWLPEFINGMRDDDVLIVTADHGCDPGTESTDHSREYVPFFMLGKGIEPENLGTVEGFDFIAETVKDLLYEDTVSDSELALRAISAMKKSYAPYSGFNVGAALLCRDGSIYEGCNIENAAFSPTVCAERVAIFKAISDGKRDFLKIAVCGGKNGALGQAAAPCGVCRQVMREFCADDFEILVVKNENDFEKFTLAELLPRSFGADNLS